MAGSIDVIWNTVREEFSDLQDLAAFTRVFVRLMLAVILGGILGYERQLTGKPAGLRTHMLVSLGAALFVLVPLQSGMPVNDVSRVLQGVIAGIGFLGAGAIIKMSEEGQIKGLTTAASIWLTAAIGVAAGLGREATAVFATVLALIILGALHKLDKWIARSAKHRNAHTAPAGSAPRELASHEE
ncbi:MgtC/SapB family protein [Bordetella sp. N]|uniref:MgtC/SapB family protein n=1 Tax=Bordetella sp. N TaxID=1746199 RepID=UPI00070DF74B|nr:MgtC/SapB family protein [Bordetella sp. N]ALM86341.1 methyltransferase [Bordetella sp. N]